MGVRSGEEDQHNPGTTYVQEDIEFGELFSTKALPLSISPSRDRHVLIRDNGKNTRVFVVRGPIVGVVAGHGSVATLGSSGRAGLDGGALRHGIQHGTQVVVVVVESSSA
jgi:hypothetical protein